MCARGRGCGRPRAFHQRTKGTHQILEHHFADAGTAHLAAEPFTLEGSDGRRILGPVNGVQSRARRYDGSQGEFKVGWSKRQCILNLACNLPQSLTS